MSSVDPNIDALQIDPHYRYAAGVESSESFNAQLGIKGNEHLGFDHAKIFVNQPIQNEAMKLLTGESIRRRFALFQLPSTPVSRQFLFDRPEYQLDRLEENLSLVQAIDCQSDDPKEQTRREQEKAILETFCEMEIARKKNYEEVRLRILEFLQG